MANAKGLDLSRYNGRANWLAVKNSGIDFVIIKCGGIFSNTGVCYTDDLVADHVAGAKSVSMPFGLYWYFLPIPGSVSKQIDFYQKLLDQYNPSIKSAFIDVESNNGQAASAITSALKVFVPAFSDMVDIAVIYTRQSWWDLNVKADPTWGGYWLWASRWASHLTAPWSDGHYKFRDWKQWLLWQYSGDNNAEAVNYGFPGPHVKIVKDKYDQGDPDLDLNWFNGDKNTFYNWANIKLEEPVKELPVQETLWDHEMRIKELERISVSV